ncbi:hypothetical protein LTR17_014403 [Elasticomyces elasticus]|nr:hypothetical protein LTR17_014403 [Elasticomyces elasticus]
MVVQLAEERDVDVVERVESDEEAAEVVDVAGKVDGDEEAAEVETTESALLEVVIAVLELIGLDEDEATLEVVLAVLELIEPDEDEAALGVLATADEELALLYGDDAGIVAELIMLPEELLAAELLGDSTTVTDTVVGVAECGGKDVVIVA